MKQGEMETKRLILTVIGLTAVLIGINHFVATRGTPIQTLPGSAIELNQPVTVSVQEDYVRYPGRDGVNAFDLLMEVTEVEFTEYDFGKFIRSINGVTPDSKHFWKLYLNSQGAQVGADQLETRDSDIIEWRLEEIEN